MKGGYLIIDLKGKSLSTTEVTIPGIYERIEGNYGKAILIEGINLGGVDKAATFAEFTVSSTTYTATIYGGALAITEDDEITFTPAE